MTHAAQFALTHGAALLFMWILLQQAGVPIPSAPLLIAVGSLASYRRLRLVPPLLATLTACLLADGFWYRVGRRGWSKSHQFCRPNSNSNWKNRVLSLIWRHSGAAMLLAKFVVGSNVVSLLAGQAGLSAARFLIYDSIGSLTWSGSYIALGYLLHGQLHWTLAQTLRPLFIVRVAVSIARLWRRRSLAHAVLALAIVFFAVRPVSQHNVANTMSTRILHDSRHLTEKRPPEIAAYLGGKDELVPAFQRLAERRREAAEALLDALPSNIRPHRGLTDRCEAEEGHPAL